MDKPFGEIVRYERTKRGWTVKRLLEALEVTISPTYMTRIERHGEIPSPTLVCKLAKILNLDQRGLWEVAKREKIIKAGELWDKQLERLRR